MTLLVQAEASPKLDTSTWKTIEPSSSRVELERLRSFQEQSYQWPPQMRIDYLSKIYSASKQLELDSVRANSSRSLGKMYLEVDSIGLALQLLNESLQYSYDHRSRSSTLNALGALHRRSQDFESALLFYFSSVEEAIADKKGDEAYPLGNISEIYAALGDYQNAIKYLKQSVGCSQQLESPDREYSLLYDYAYLIDFYQEIGRKDSSAKYVELTLQNIKLIDSIQVGKFMNAKFVGFMSVADHHLLAGDNGRADHFIALSRKHAPPLYLTSVMQLEARSLMLQGQHLAALEVLNSKALRECEVDREQILQLKAKCLQSLKRYEQAIAIKDSLQTLREQQFNLAHAQHSSFANVKYETQAKNKEIAALRQATEINSLTIKNQRYFVALCLLLTLASLAALSFLWRLIALKKKKNALLEDKVTQRTKELSRANEELLIMNFVASHDLKEPMRTIEAYVNLINENLPSHVQLENEQFFNYINKSLKHTHSLLEDMAKFHKFYEIKDVELGEVDLSQLIDDIGAGSQIFIREKNGKIARDALPVIRSHSSILYAVLKNLIENGMKFNDKPQPQVQVRYQLRRDHHCISIIDNGIGIDDKFHDHIFVSFKRLHSKDLYSGSGLGLSICKLLIEKIGGEIQVNSQKGQGSRFCVLLPA